MTEEGRLFYRLAPGIDVVSIGEGALLFRSDTLTARIEGPSTALFQERILPLLDGGQSLAEVASAQPSLDAGDLRRQLDALVKVGVLERTGQLPSWPSGETAPLLALLQAAGLPATKLRSQLACLRIAVFGLEGAGAHAAVLLAACGVGELFLVDPYPFQPGNIALMPLVGAVEVGTRRDEALKQSLDAQGTDTRTEVGLDAITPDGIDTLASTCQLLIGAFDKGLSVVNYWLNTASMTQGVPVIYSQLAAHIALVGPVVVPTKSACYACWRRRSLACEDSYSEAIAYENLLYRQQKPRLHERPALPALAAYAGSLVATEAIKLLLSVGSGSLAGKVHEFDAMRFHSQTHPLIQVPNCPECGKRRPRAQPSPAEVLHSDKFPGDILQAAESLVSPRCGVITDFEPVPKDPGEPTKPYLFGARLANHRFVEDRAAADDVCGGKGLTLAEAQASALGEAVEWYAASCIPTEHLLYSTCQALDVPSLNPADLVLYRPEQYAEVPYAPYTDTTILGWVEGHSLLTGSTVLVPAVAVFLGYLPRAPEEWICPSTSTGLAAGPTLAEAMLSALYEVLERDAFIVTWMNRLPAERVPPATHPDPELVDLCEAYARRGVELRLYHLAVDHPCHVFLSLAVQDGGDGWPAAVAGLGADLDPARAASKAIMEAGQVRSSLRTQVRDPATRARIERLVADPRLVATIDDHALLYAHPGAAGAFAFLERSPEIVVDWTMPNSSATDRLRRLAEHFRTHGGDVLYYDVTASDLEEFGLRTVRVIVPGFQPLHFGRQPRLGGRRLYELPRRLGISEVPARPELLNMDPHPLA
jgi:ribosomal protein S12 methylthiotransferase accessory factor